MPMINKGICFNEHHSLGCNAQLLVESLSARLSAQKLLQKLHLVNAATSFQNGVAVSTTFLAIHGVLLEERVEHVQGKDLRIEVAIVAGIITTEEVANVGISVAPFPRKS